MNPVIALELLATGAWAGAGVLGPEAFDAVPYLDLMRTGYGQLFGVEERPPPASLPDRPRGPTPAGTPLPRAPHA